MSFSMSRPVMYVTSKRNQVTNQQPTNQNSIEPPPVASSPPPCPPPTPPLPVTPPPTPETTMKGSSTFMWTGNIEVTEDITKILTFPYLPDKYKLESMDFVIAGFGKVEFILSDACTHETLAEFALTLDKDINIINHDTFEKLPEETDNTALELHVHLSDEADVNYTTIEVLSVAVNM